MDNKLCTYIVTSQIRYQSCYKHPDGKVIQYASFIDYYYTFKTNFQIFVQFVDGDSGVINLLNTNCLSYGTNFTNDPNQCFFICPTFLEKSNSHKKCLKCSIAYPGTKEVIKDGNCVPTCNTYNQIPDQRGKCISCTLPKFYNSGACKYCHEIGQDKPYIIKEFVDLTALI